MKHRNTQKLFIIILGRINNSLKRLIEGGAAILITQNKNHHKVNPGTNNKNPLLNTKLRLWLFSYVKPAKKNKADEHNP
jgi:hypothetical protein